MITLLQVFKGHLAFPRSARLTLVGRVMGLITGKRNDFAKLLLVVDSVLRQILRV